MHQTEQLRDVIQSRINAFIDDQQTRLREVGTDFAPLITEAFDFLQGGKRLRAQFLILGYEAVRPLPHVDPREDAEVSRVLDAACALEFFHAAALVHDDIIDRSDSRRGRPASHRIFAHLHEQHSFRGNAEHFGMSAAILLGDLLQSWADECLQDALDAMSDGQAARSAREHFNRMRSEVAVGQYLDVLEEQYEHFTDHHTQLERSTRVLIYKSAKYSVQAPLLIGAALAGASDTQMQALANFGLPVGVAFQLRDDLLGVFGDERLTGKPAGDDLAEGKRTVLVTLAREALSGGPRRTFDDLHGDPDLDATQIRILQDTIRETQAHTRVESMISNNLGIAREALSEAQLNADTVAALMALAEFAAKRDA